VTEVFVASADATVDGTVVTFKGFIPKPYFRSLIPFEKFKPTVASFESYPKSFCYALARTSRNDKYPVTILGDGSVQCDTLDTDVPSALHGNVSLRIAVDCENDFHKDCFESSIFQSYTDAYNLVTTNETWIFRIADRTITPIREDQACAIDELDNQPMRQNEDFTYDDFPASRRSTTATSTWCTNTQLKTMREKTHDDFWNNVLSRKLAQRSNSAAIQKNWEQCFKSCGSTRRDNIWKTKQAACLELLHRAPMTIGGEKRSNNTANFMSFTSKFVDLVCPNVTQGKSSSSANSDDTVNTVVSLPGQGTRTCISSTEIYQLMVFNFNLTYKPVDDQPTVELMFKGNRNPTPVLQQLQSLYAMHVTGVVTVWATHKEFTKLTGTDSPLKALLVYNTNVTLVRIMVETPQLNSFLSALLPAFLVNWITAPKSCDWYITKIEQALNAWRTTACPSISRAVLLPNNKGEVAPYEVNVIDAQYNGWGDKTKPKTKVLENCAI